MAQRYRVTLTKEERQELKAISTKGKRGARTVLYARALLLPELSDFMTQICADILYAKAFKETTGIPVWSVEDSRKALACKRSVQKVFKLQ